MALSIKKNDKIQGIKITVSNTTYHIKVTQYADDCTLFLAGLNNIPEALAQINKFTKVSGLKLNIEKTEGMNVGTQRPVNDKIYNIKFVNKSIKFLGIYVGENETACNEENWNEKILKIEKILASWKHRDLTIFGKILIIKTLALSIITHVAISLTVSSKIIKRLNKLFYGFIWGKRDRMKRNILRLPLDSGGANMVDVESFFASLKAAWVPKILNSKSTWSCLGNKYLSELGTKIQISNFCFDKKYSVKELANLPDFYKEIVFAYGKSNITNKPETLDDVLEQPLWGNKHINIYNKDAKREITLNFKEWASSNLLYVKDLKFSAGKIDANYIYNNVNNKRDIYKQILSLRKALRPFHLILNEYTPQVFEYDNSNSTFVLATNSKFYYTKLSSQLKSHYILGIWTRMLDISPEDYQCIFKQKLVNIFDLKIKEFNFKVLHGILSCESNLKIWKLQDNDNCIVCKGTHSILHMLYECPIANDVWLIFQAFFKFKITQNAIICGVKDKISNFLISLISFCLYKYWIILKNENSNCILKTFLLKELCFRRLVYLKLKQINLCEKISEAEEIIKKEMPN